MLEVRLLGQFDVRQDGRSVTIPSRAAQSLFAYLILNAGTAHRRERLAGLFWPDSSDKHARDNLRHALWRIRKTLESRHSLEGRCILVDEISISFDRQSDYWLDTSILECAASERATTADLMELLALYRGELLPGFYDDWVALERERLQALFEQEIQQLLDRLVQEQRWASVLEWGERWIAFGHTPEAAYRALMIAHGARGDQSKVAAVFQRCVQMLHDDLGFGPSEQTRALFKRLTRSEATTNAVYVVEQSSKPPARNNARQLPPAPSSPPVLAAQSMPSVATGPFVARERELSQLDTFLNSALSGGGQIIFISGESGSGKTLLAQEFSLRAQTAHADLVVAHGICDAYTGIGDPYLPFREILNQLTGDVEARWTGGIITQENASRLRAFMPASLPALIDHGPELIDIFVPNDALRSRAAAVSSAEADWLMRLEKLSARQMVNASSAAPDQKHICEQYAKVLQAIAEQAPVLLILDDLHWADVSSISLLFHLSRRIKGSRILIVGTYRPEDIVHGESGKPHPLQGVLGELKRYSGDILIDLDRVSILEGRHFVDALVDTERNELGERFRRALFEHTEGHALFTTELLRTMQARGDLQQDGTGQWVEAHALDWETLPMRVEGVIEKRIARLSAPLRQALLVASVEGEEFTAEIIARVERLDEHEVIRELSDELNRQDRLVSAQRVQWTNSRRLSLYRFRHNLFQKYLYRTLDEVQRTHLHAKVGNALEALYGDQTDQVATQLARHFQAAGKLNKAVDYLLLAGEKSRHLSANQEAIDHFSHGLALLGTMPDTPEQAQREVTLQIPLGNALIAIKGYAAPEVGQTFSRARELCRQIGETRQLLPVLHGLHRYFLTRGDVQAAHEIGEQLANLAQVGRDPDWLTEADRALGLTLWYVGELDVAQKWLDQSTLHYHRERHSAYVLHYGQDPGVVCLSYTAWALWFLGYPDRALKRSAEALSLARELSHPYSLAQTLSLAAVLHQFRNEAPAAQALAEEALALASRHGFTYWSAASTVLRGWAFAELGQVEAGISQIRQGLFAWQTMGIEVGRAYFLALLAAIYSKTQQAEVGLHVLHEALNGQAGIGRWVEAELYRLKGELLLKLGAPIAEAEKCFWQAIETARRQGARSLELRTVTSLSRLWKHEGKTQEAQQRLAEAYNWFSEGLDTTDLKEAKALLEALA